MNFGAEDLNFELNEEYFKRLDKKYKARFDVMQSTLGKEFTETQRRGLGVLLENTNNQFARSSRMLSLNESTQVANVYDGIKTQYFDIISAVFPNLIAEKLFSVQPIRSKTAQIFYLKYVYGSNKGQVHKGDTIFSATEIGGYEGKDYTSEVVEDEEMETITAPDSGNKVIDGHIQYIPLKPGSMVFKLGNHEAREADGKITSLDGFLSGTIDYTTGAYHIVIPEANIAEVEGETMYVDYEYDMSYAPSTIPALDLQITQTTINARPRKLKGVYSLDAGYDLKMSQGIDIDDALLEAAAQVLKNEVDADLITSAIAQANMSITWNKYFNNMNAGISRREFYEDFIDTINRASTMIKKRTKRVAGNWLVVGKQGADILTYLGAPRFIASGDTTAVGPHFLGTLDGRISVYDDLFLPDDEFLVGYKGSTLMDAGLIYAPYLLFFATNTVMLEDFLGRRGFATTYGKKMVNANMYVRGKIINKNVTGDNGKNTTEEPTV